MYQEENVWTVYQHKFPNGYYYIGITSQQPEERWNNGNGYKGQKVYELISKYDWNEIEHDILYTHLSREQANAIEQHLISAWREVNPELISYNIASGGHALICYGKTVYQYNTNGQYIATFPSATEAAKQTGTANSSMNITSCCRGTRRSANGYYWSYTYYPSLPQEILQDIQVRRDRRPNKTEEEKHPFKIDQYDLNGNFIQSFHTIVEAEAQTGIEKNSISRCTLGKQHTAGGFQWTKHNIPLQQHNEHIIRAAVEQYDLNDNYITTYPSVAAANRALTGTSKGHIANVCKGLARTAYGYKWKYKIDT